MGRIKPKIVSKLMNIANRFADGEDVCNNKRTRSPEDDRRNRYGSQRRRSQNYDNHGYHNQVVVGYKDNGYQGGEHRSLGYQSYGKEDYKKFPTRESREYNPSPEDMLNRPCHIHSAFVDIQACNERLHNILEATRGSIKQTNRSKVTRIRRKQQASHKLAREQQSASRTRPAKPGA
jgi:hypothetical protein